MVRGIRLLFAFFIIGMAARLPAADLPTCAVMTFEAKNGVSKEEASILAERLEAQLIALEKYRLVSRENLAKVLEAQRMAMECSGTECAIEAGKIAAIQYVIFGSVGKVGSTYSLTANLANVETGVSEKTAWHDQRGAIDDLLVNGVGIVACKLMGLPPPEPVRALPVYRYEPPPPPWTKRKGTPSPNAPILWSTLDSPADIAASKIGAGGKLHGNPVFEPGISGNGVSFRNASGIQYDPDLLPGYDEPATYEMWIRMPGKITEQALLMWSMQGQRIGGMCLRLQEKDYRFSSVYMCNASGDDLVGGDNLTPALEPGRWYHFALVWDFVNRIDGRDTLRVYLDGEVVYRMQATRPADRLNRFASVGSHANFTLGAQGYGGTMTVGFDGVVDEFKVWDHVVTNFPSSR